MKRVALLSAALLLSVTASFGSGVLVEAESFRDKGGWAVDQQFMDQMGSPYLIAHGMGKPVADAVTTVEFPETGTYRVYVRTFNWVAPWYDGEGPGKFALRVGSRKLSATLGCTGKETGKRHPTIGNHVTISAGAAVFAAMNDCLAQAAQG